MIRRHRYNSVRWGEGRSGLVHLTTIDDEISHSFRTDETPTRVFVTDFPKNMWQDGQSSPMTYKAVDLLDDIAPSGWDYIYTIGGTKLLFRDKEIRDLFLLIWDK